MRQCAEVRAGVAGVAGAAPGLPLKTGEKEGKITVTAYFRSDFIRAVFGFLVLCPQILRYPFTHFLAKID